MPWCDTCSKFWNPTSMPAEGRCPNCASPLAARDPGAAGSRPPGGAGAGGAGTGEADSIDGLDDVKAPWHFKVLVVVTAVYIGWRIVQLVASVL